MNTTNKIGLELERRFKISKKDIPTGNIIETLNIEQNYAIRGRIMVRIRHIYNDMTDQYIHGVKYKLDVGIKEEIESFINKEQYGIINAFIGKKPIRKIRHIIPLKCGHKAEIDIFDNITRSPIVEVEFFSVEDMKNFKKPDWFGEEILVDSYTEKMFALLNGELEDEDDLDLI